jgi:glutathione S-transferase
MSDRIRFSLIAECRDKVRAVLPMASAADMAGFDALLVRDCIVTDDGEPHPELVAWVQRILDRDAGGALAVPVSPVPKVGPAAAEVVL